MWDILKDDFGRCMRRNEPSKKYSDRKTIKVLLSIDNSPLKARKHARVFEFFF